MIDRSVGFIGGGRVTRIFLQGWARAGKLPARMTVSDPNEETIARLETRYPSITATSDNLKAAAQELVFLALHPPAIAETAAHIKGTLAAGAMVISLAPKVTLAGLTGLLGGFDRIARIIPNAPSVVGLGYNPVVYARALSAGDREVLEGLLAPLGCHPETTEAKLEAYAVLSGMGPTYLWFQLQALREVAEGFGLSGSEVAAAMVPMVAGTARTLLESGLSPAEVMDLVPVRPLAEMEPQVTEMYRSRLPALYRKIRP